MVLTVPSVRPPSIYYSWDGLNNAKVNVYYSTSDGVWRFGFRLGVYVGVEKDFEITRKKQQHKPGMIHVLYGV